MTTDPKDTIMRNAAAQSAVELEVAKKHLETATESLRQVKEQISMRTVAIAQVAATLMACAHPQFQGYNLHYAVQKAREILREAELQELMDFADVTKGRQDRVDALNKITDRVDALNKITKQRKTPDPGR